MSRNIVIPQEMGRNIVIPQEMGRNIVIPDAKQIRDPSSGTQPIDPEYEWPDQPGETVTLMDNPRTDRLAWQR